MATSVLIKFRHNCQIDLFFTVMGYAILRKHANASTKSSHASFLSGCTITQLTGVIVHKVYAIILFLIFFVVYIFIEKGIARGGGGEQRSTLVGVYGYVWQKSPLFVRFSFNKGYNFPDFYVTNSLVFFNLSVELISVT